MRQNATVRVYVGVTDAHWSGFLAERPRLEEVNFWRPSAKAAFGVLNAGEPFLFKTHHPHNSIIGGGFYEGFVRLRVSEAWDFFGEGNGVASADGLRDAISRYRKDEGTGDDDPTIGCVILSDVTWFGDQSLPGPESFAKNVVQGRGYETGEDPVVDLALTRLFSPIERVYRGLLGELPAVIAGPTRGEPMLAVPRLHQGAFRALVLQAYDSHCALTGHKIRPTLQAAHIRPVANGGEHRVDNGLLLRSDIHTLFDLGYLSVDAHHRPLVSPRLRNDFGNGDDLYALAAAANPILLPRRHIDRPSQDALEWHRDQVFLS